MPSQIEMALTIIYELIKSVLKSKMDKFEKEWEKDKQEFLKALQNGEADKLNALIAKYTGDF